MRLFGVISTAAVVRMSARVRHCRYKDRVAADEVCNVIGNTAFSTAIPGSIEVLNCEHKRVERFLEQEASVLSHVLSASAQPCC